jgi:hypothetical protein
MIAHERQDLLLERLDGDRADLLVADHARLVDDERLWHAVDAVVEAHRAVAVDDGHRVGVAVLREPALARGGLVLVIQADDRHHLGLAELDQQRVLLAAGHAPRCPHVEQPHLALHVGGAERLVGRVQLVARERRGRLADQRRRHLARIEAQPDQQEGEQDGEDAERNEQLAVHRISARRPRPRGGAPRGARRGGSGDR